MRVLFIFLCLWWPTLAYSHTGTLDAYGCHSNKALLGNTSKRECHTGLLAGKVFASTTEEYKAYIDAQKVLLQTLQAELAACKGTTPPPPPPPSGPVLSATPSTVSAGASVSVSIANGPGNAKDWVGLYAKGATHTSFLSWQYLNGSHTSGTAGQSSATLSFPMPATAGTYEFRFFADDGFGLLVTSGPVVVTTAQGSLTITWKANAEPDLAGYRVYCGKQSGVYDTQVSIGKTLLTATVPNLTSGTYFCVVKAYDTAGNESGPSQEVSKVIP